MGILVIIATSWLLTDPIFVMAMTQTYNHYYIALYVFLGIGILVTTGAICGCCGVLKESQGSLVRVSVLQCY